MAGNKTGAAKTKLKLIEKYGGEVGYLLHLQDISVKGGKSPHTGKRGFAAFSKDKLLAAASKGGKGKKVV